MTLSAVDPATAAPPLDRRVVSAPLLDAWACDEVVRIATPQLEPVVPRHGGTVSAWPVDEIDDLPGVAELHAAVREVDRLLGWGVPLDIARFSVVRYTPGDHMPTHVDDEERGPWPWDLPHRGISCSLQLSEDGDYDGGDVLAEAWTARPDPWERASRERGTATLFGSSLPHQVTPVARGERWVLLAWMYTNHDMRDIR